MVIGGAAIYAGALPLCERIYLTEIHAEISGDTWFVGYDAGEWRERDRIDHPPDPANRYPYSFVVLERAGRGRGCDGGGVARNSGARSATDRT
ncbi:MAG: dihydrofolate reductase [Gammaproteobacteria bacterium]